MDRNIFDLLEIAAAMISQFSGGRKVKLTLEYCDEIEDKLLSLIKMVAKDFRLSTDDISGPSRARKLTDARCAYTYIAYTHLNEPMKNIAGSLNRERTACIYFLQKAKDMISIDDYIVAHIQRIENQLLNNANRGN